MPRIATHAWVGALLRRAGAAGAFGAVLHRGDSTAGAVILCLRDRAGSTTVLSRVAHREEPAWACALSLPAGAEDELATYLDKQRRYDPDLWVIELTGDNLEQFVDGTVLKG